MRHARYIVIRTRELLGYREYLGPVVSTPRTIHYDARRLYRKPGHRLRWVAWSRATAWQRSQCRGEGAPARQAATDRITPNRERLP